MSPTYVHSMRRLATLMLIAGSVYAQDDPCKGEPNGVKVRRLDNGSVLETRCFNGRRHGTERRRTADGTLMYETPYVDGRKHGVERLWGQSETPYVDGKRHGIATFRDADGNVIRRAHYVNGKDVGQNDKEELSEYIAYGPATTVTFFDNPHMADFRVDSEGSMWPGSIVDHEARPGFVLAYLRSGSSRRAQGPMLVTDVKIDGSDGPSVGSIGVGYLVTWRPKKNSSSGSINGFGLGVAFMLDTGVKTLRDGFDPKTAMPGLVPDIGYVSKTRNSVALIVTWSFGQPLNGRHSPSEISN